MYFKVVDNLGCLNNIVGTPDAPTPLNPPQDNSESIVLYMIYTLNL